MSTDKPTKKRDYHFDSQIRAVAISSCAPAIRMYWIQAGFCERFWSRVYSVIAVKTTVRNGFSRKLPMNHWPQAPLSDVDLQEKGWIFYGQQTEDELMVYDDEYGVISTSHELMNEDKMDVCFCPWDYDADRDQQEINKVVAFLEKEVMKRNQPSA